MIWCMCRASLNDWSNGGCVDVFLTSVVSLLMVSMVLVFRELILFKGIYMGFKNKIMLHWYKNVKYQQIQEFDNRCIII